MIHKLCVFISKSQTDINELSLPKNCYTEFPDPDDLLNFKIVICPDEGYYKLGKFAFRFKVSRTLNLTHNIMIFHGH